VVSSIGNKIKEAFTEKEIRIRMIKNNFLEVILDEFMSNIQVFI
jgi:hypothetical protein